VDVPWLEVTLEEHASAEVDIVARVVRRHLTYGSQTGRISIPIDDVNHDCVTILALARAVMALRPVPAHVFLQGNQRQCVRLLGQDGVPAKAVAVSCAAEWVDVCLRPVGAVEVTTKGRAQGGAPATVCVTDSDGRRARFSVSVLK
jgi:hypothetical protein